MKKPTKLAHLGRNSDRFEGAVNPPVFRASTVLSPDSADWATKKAEQQANVPGFYYGRSGTPTSEALLEVVAELEGGHAAAAFPSGLAACAGAILSVAGAGHHVLVADGAYGPVRKLCDGLLARLGIETTYFAADEPDIGRLFRPNTRVLYLESPASHSMELLDVGALSAVARRQGAVTMLDNTWSGLCCFDPFDKGVDISVHAATKYIVGHSDVVAGIAIANEAAWPSLRETALALGQTLSPDDAYLTLRGLRTLSVRMERHDANGRALAKWLSGRREVSRVLHPALPDHPQHALWQRDFTGASGLFSIVLSPDLHPHVNVLVDRLELFGLGASWGGYESLILSSKVTRTATMGDLTGLVRLHAGLEDIDDLIGDLAQALDAMSKVAQSA